jgi:thioredoxin-related protein
LKKRLLVAVVSSIFSISLFGNSADFEDINWNADYEEAINIAKIDKKPTMVLITSTRCKWCKKMKEKTLSNENIIGRLNSKFSTVEVTRKSDEYPEDVLRARAVPTIYFLDTDGKPMMRPVVGYWNVENFQSYLDDAEKVAKKVIK